MGENPGRYFIKQLLDVLDHIQSKGVVHRDLKLENILLDDQLNIKVADFGFATYKHINKLNSYRGTLTYMAPEIKEGKEYDGRKVDIFSSGVILFIIVLGIFPFREAKPDEYFYSLIKKGDLKTYWKKVGGENLSDEFKDLFIKMVNYNPEKRPTVGEIKNHSWFNQKIIEKDIRQNLFERLQDKRSQKTTESSRDGEIC